MAQSKNGLFLNVVFQSFKMIVYFVVREQAEAWTVVRLIDCCRSEYFAKNCISKIKDLSKMLRICKEDRIF